MPVFAGNHLLGLGVGHHRCDALLGLSQQFAVVVNDGEYQVDERTCPIVCHGAFQPGVMFPGFFGVGSVAEDEVAAEQQGLEFCVEFAVVDVGHGHAVAEHRKTGNETVGQGAAGVETLHRFKQVGDEGVNLVVGAG